MERQNIAKTSEGKLDVANQHSTCSSDPPHASSHQLHKLQRTFGNRALGRFIQAKLEVSQPGDAFEQEADRVADTVMAGNSAPIGHVSQGVQRKLYRMETRPEDAVDSVPPPETEEEVPAGSPTEEVQRSASGDASGMTPQFEHSLQQAVGGGQALPSATRSLMESRFGRDFSSVRVHSDTRANTLAREASARAFTLDRDIFFAGSEYQPNNTEGQRLLAHELTHVVQQSTGQISRQIQRQTSCSEYPGVTGAALNTYNCSGLATRTYRNIPDANLTVDAIIANFTEPGSPGAAGCGAGKVKFWLWQYDMRSTDAAGTPVGPAHRDFHIVAGETGLGGADPTDVMSKNGFRPVHGPGTGPSFQPPARARYLANNASETPANLPDGREWWVARSNMTEEISCAGCYP